MSKTTRLASLTTDGFLKITDGLNALDHRVSDLEKNHSEFTDIRLQAELVTIADALDRLTHRLDQLDASATTPPKKKSAGVD